MSNKQRFQELLIKLKEWSAANGNDQLNEHLNELETEINAMAAPVIEAQADGDEGGNSPSEPPDII